MTNVGVIGWNVSTKIIGILKFWIELNEEGFDMGGSLLLSIRGKKLNFKERIQFEGKILRKIF